MFPLTPQRVPAVLPVSSVARVAFAECTVEGIAGRKDQAAEWAWMEKVVGLIE